jgi:hypothetical protein
MPLFRHFRGQELFFVCIYLRYGACNEIVRASEYKNAEEMIDQGYKVYEEVLGTLPKPFPVIILPRPRESFNKNETLLGVDDNEKSSASRFWRRSRTSLKTRDASAKKRPNSWEAFS